MRISRAFFTNHAMRATAAALLISSFQPAWSQENRFTIAQALSAPFPFDLVAALKGGSVAWLANERGARNVWVSEPMGSGGYKARRLTAWTEDDGVDLANLRWSGDASRL